MVRQCYHLHLTKGLRDRRVKVKVARIKVYDGPRITHREDHQSRQAAHLSSRSGSLLLYTTNFPPNSQLLEITQGELNTFLGDINNKLFCHMKWLIFKLFWSTKPCPYNLNLAPTEYTYT